MQELSFQSALREENNMSVLIFDSNGELWHTRAEELGLDYISMPYYVGGEEYFYDLGKATDFKGFYEKVRSG